MSVITATITDNEENIHVAIATGGGRKTNLSYIASPTDGVVVSSTGTDATILAATELNAGLLLPAEKTKLASIQAGAGANVNADWNATEGDALILNKPTLGTAAAANVGDFATAAQGTKADSALQSADIGVSVQGYSSVLANTTASYTTEDKSKLDGIQVGAEVNVNADWNAVAGDALILNKPTLGTAAFANVGDFATATQGVTADSALQPEDIGVSVQGYSSVLANTTASYTIAAESKLASIADGAEVNVNADWNAVSGDALILNKPILGTAAAANIGDFATATQGATADSALQPSDIGVSVQGYSSVLANTTASFTTVDKSKLDGIAAGAEVNVNADWNAVTGDALILNKPTLGTAAAANVGDFATAAQGVKADTALQPGTIGVTVQGYSSILANTTASFTIAYETKLSYLEGVTSPIQDQINSKANTDSPSLTGTPTSTTPSITENSTRIATTAYVANGYRYIGTRVFTTGTAATYTPTTGTRLIVVKVFGATGGGGGVDGQGADLAAIGGAGGNGGYAEKVIVVGSQTFTYTIGAAGVGGAAGANNGTAGGTTSFTGSTSGTVQVTGGAGGEGRLATPNGSPTLANVGVGSGGDINYRGNQSLSPRWYLGILYVASNNGCPLFGGGISDGLGSQAGANSLAIGAAGTGATVTSGITTNYAGGNGFRGEIRIEEYI